MIPAAAANITIIRYISNLRLLSQFMEYYNSVTNMYTFLWQNNTNLIIYDIEYESIRKHYFKNKLLDFPVIYNSPLSWSIYPAFISHVPNSLPDELQFICCICSTFYPELITICVVNYSYDIPIYNARIPAIILEYKWIFNNYRYFHIFARY